MLGSIRPLFMSLAAVAACASLLTEAADRPRATQASYARPPLMKVVDELDRRQMAVETVIARLNIVLRDHEKNKTYPLTGVYIGDKDGNLRMRITAQTGQMILDMGAAGDGASIYLPRKGRYFRGKRQDLLDTPDCQLSLLFHAGKARDLFFPRAWGDKAVDRRVVLERGREVINVIEKPGLTRKRTRRVSIAPDATAVESMEVFDTAGREVGEIQYAKYRACTPESDPSAEQLPYPGQVVLRTPNGRHTLEMNVEEMILNSPIPVEKFDVPKPEDVNRTLDLATSLARNGNLWE